MGLNLIAAPASQSRGEIVVVPSADCHVQSTVNTGRSISRQEGFGVAREGSLSAEFTNLGNLERVSGLPGWAAPAGAFEIVAALVTGVGLQPPPPLQSQTEWMSLDRRFNFKFVPQVCFLSNVQYSPN